MHHEEIVKKLQVALQAYQGNDLNSAEVIFHEILAVNSKDPTALHLLGCIYKDRGELPQAVEMIQASIREDGTNPIPFINLAKILYIAGQYDDSVDVLRESLKLNQQIPDTWFCLANALRKLEKIEDAIQAYRNVLILNPAYLGASVNLGALLTGEGQLEEAEHILSKTLQQNPQNLNCRINYGKLFSEKEEHALAIDQYRIALLIAPDSAELLFNYANSLKEERQVEEAITNYRKAIEVKPDFLEAYLNLGNLLTEDGQVEEAIANYRKAIELKPDLYKHKRMLLNLQAEQNVRETVSLENYRDYHKGKDIAGILIAAYPSFDAIPSTRRSVNSWADDKFNTYFNGNMFAYFSQFPWLWTRSFADSINCFIPEFGTKFLDTSDTYRASNVFTLQVRLSQASVISSVLEPLARKLGRQIDVLDVGGWSGNALFLSGWNDSWDVVRSWKVLDIAAVCEPSRSQLPGLLEQFPEDSGGRRNLSKLSFEDLNTAFEFRSRCFSSVDLIWSSTAQHYNFKFPRDLAIMLESQTKVIYLDTLPYLCTYNDALNVSEFTELHVGDQMVSYICSKKYLSELVESMSREYGYSFKMWSQLVEPKIVFWQPQKGDVNLPKKIKDDAEPLLMKVCSIRFDKLD